MISFILWGSALGYFLTENPVFIGMLIVTLPLYLAYIISKVKELETESLAKRER